MDRRNSIVRENPTWRPPRVHGDLRKPGFGVDERLVDEATPIPRRFADAARSQGARGWPASGPGSSRLARLADGLHVCKPHAPKVG